jgi:ABC-type transporter MlaC component
MDFKKSLSLLASIFFLSAGQVFSWSVKDVSAYDVPSDDDARNFLKEEIKKLLESLTSSTGQEKLLQQADRIIDPFVYLKLISSVVKGIGKTTVKEFKESKGYPILEKNLRNYIVKIFSNLSVSKESSNYTFEFVEQPSKTAGKVDVVFRKKSSNDQPINTSWTVTKAKLTKQEDVIFLVKDFSVEGIVMVNAKAEELSGLYKNWQKKNPGLNIAEEVGAQSFSEYFLSNASSSTS